MCRSIEVISRAVQFNLYGYKLTIGCRYDASCQLPLLVVKILGLVYIIELKSSQCYPQEVWLPIATGASGMQVYIRRILLINRQNMLYLELRRRVLVCRITRRQLILYHGWERVFVLWWFLRSFSIFPHGGCEAEGRNAGRGRLRLLFTGVQATISLDWNKKIEQCRHNLLEQMRYLIVASLHKI